jgi:hypothetical protein
MLPTLPLLQLRGQRRARACDAAERQWHDLEIAHADKHHACRHGAAASLTVSIVSRISDARAYWRIGGSAYAARAQANKQSSMT